MQEEYKLRFEGISKVFPGVVALDGVSFGVRRGTVHVLMGENGAGKSTLMKIINGTQQQTAGRMYLDGKEVSFRSVHEAGQHGIGMIGQELSYIPDMTIEKYLMLCREHRSRVPGFIDWGRTRAQARELLEREGLHYDPRLTMREISISDIQILEITKCISSEGIDVLIMDEPTSALSNKEVARLFGRIRALKEKGITILYISHKMDEIFQIADDITVMRDGRHIRTAPAADYTPESMVTMMVGRRIDDVYPKEAVTLGDTVLEVRGFSTRYTNVSGLDFSVRAGEIVGLAGLMGAGRTETARGLFGMDELEAGEIRVDGKVVRIRSVPDAVRCGIAMATEDRRRYGMVGCRSIRENIALPNLRRLRRGPFVDRKKEGRLVGELFRQLRIKAPGEQTQARTLSGGNQQKVVLAKWLLAKPRVLILDEPTRGIDVGAKYEIYRLMTQLAREGIAILLISSELPEFIGMCDRCYTMYNGRITGELSRAEMTQENIMLHCAGGNQAWKNE